MTFASFGRFLVRMLLLGLKCIQTLDLGFTGFVMISETIISTDNEKYGKVFWCFQPASQS